MIGNTLASSNAKITTGTLGKLKHKYKILFLIIYEYVAYSLGEWLYIIYYVKTGSRNNISLWMV